MPSRSPSSTSPWCPSTPLGPLAKGPFFALLALGKELGQTIPDLKPGDTIAGAEAISIMLAEYNHLFGRRQHH